MPDVAMPDVLPRAPESLVEGEGVAKAVPWTPSLVAVTVLIFGLAGLAEIGGGWLVWQTIRNHRPWWYLVVGSIILVCYGLVPTLQPKEVNFSRVYAVYGGIFIIMSYMWGWVVDKDRPDTGDLVGASIATGGVLAAWFWPR